MPHQLQILFAFAHRSVVQTGSAYAQQLTLPANADFGMISLHQ
jgi:hypothetical protein